MNKEQLEWVQASIRFLLIEILSFDVNDPALRDESEHGRIEVYWLTRKYRRRNRNMIRVDIYPK